MIAERVVAKVAIVLAVDLPSRLVVIVEGLKGVVPANEAAVLVCIVVAGEALVPVVNSSLEGAKYSARVVAKKIASMMQSTTAAGLYCSQNENARASAATGIASYTGGSFGSTTRRASTS